MWYILQHWRQVKLNPFSEMAAADVLPFQTPGWALKRFGATKSDSPQNK